MVFILEPSGVFGVLDLHGEERRSWTRLSTPVTEGATEIVVQDAMNWSPGDHVVIAPTGYDMYQSEVRQIKSLVDDKTLELDAPLVFNHDGQLIL